jgi:hypothetical protein
MLRSQPSFPTSPACVLDYRAVTDVAKKIGEQWKTLSDKEKKVRHI